MDEGRDVNEGTEVEMENAGNCASNQTEEGAEFERETDDFNMLTNN